MKKVLCILCLLLLPALCATAAEPELSMTGPETIYPNEDFSLQLSLDLPEVTEVSFAVDYPTELLRSLGVDWSSRQDWLVSTDSGRWILRYAGDGDGQTLPPLRFQIENLSPGTALWVQLCDVVITAGSEQHSIAAVRWEGTVSRVLNEDNALAALAVAEGTISPEFAPRILNYTLQVPYEVVAVTVTAQTRDPLASYAVSDTALAPGGSTDIRITVTAENGTQRVYILSVTRLEQTEPPTEPPTEPAITGEPTTLPVTAVTTAATYATEAESTQDTAAVTTAPVQVSTAVTEPVGGTQDTQADTASVQTAVPTQTAVSTQPAQTAVSTLPSQSAVTEAPTQSQLPETLPTEPTVVSTQVAIKDTQPVTAAPTTAATAATILQTQPGMQTSQTVTTQETQPPTQQTQGTTVQTVVETEIPTEPALTHQTDDIQVDTSGPAEDTTQPGEGENESVPGWVYILTGVAAVTGIGAAGLLLSERRK